jgi:hypothetical protein
MYPTQSLSRALQKAASLGLLGLLLTTMYGCGMTSSLKGSPQMDAALVARPCEPILLPEGPATKQDLLNNLAENMACAADIRRQLNALIDELESRNENP